MYNEFMDFSEWLDEKYNEWVSKHGRRSETEFAKEMGISQANINAWRLRTRGAPKSKELIDKIGAIYPDVYEVLGYTKPEGDPRTLEAERLFEQLTEDQQAQALTFLKFLVSLQGGNERTTKTLKKTNPDTA